ncbi:S8 family peptidase [Aminicella lysinilytica]|jgi:subtilisin family serine protease|uniref:S8 family peptidase n=1 Tax=Aminicella lysinilytica TaxID=433323 RepID=UPI0026EE620A|nr:S8 family peptidase [Aminicella lysinilytica]
MFKKLLLIVVSLCTVLLVCNITIGNTDPYFNKQWGMQNDNYSIHAKKMWSNIDNNKNTILVAIVDTGIDFNHPELSNVQWLNSREKVNGIDDDNNGYIDDTNGWNFTNSSCNTMDYIDTIKENSHGTAVAGIIAAQKNGIGIQGVFCDNNIKLVSLKILQSNNASAKFPRLIKAIQYAESCGARICNISNCVYTNDAKLRSLIQSSQMLFVVSAGNDGKNLDNLSGYIGSYHLNNLITVAAVDSTGILYSFSNYGNNCINIAAPGINIYTTTAGNDYDYVTGTSFAAPFVSGVAALLLRENPDLNSADLKRIILDKAIKNKHISHYINEGRLLDGRCCNIVK